MLLLQNSNGKRVEVAIGLGVSSCSCRAVQTAFTLPWSSLSLQFLMGLFQPSLLLLLQTRSLPLLYPTTAVWCRSLGDHLVLKKPPALKLSREDELKAAAQPATSAYEALHVGLVSRRRSAIVGDQ